MSSIIVNFFNFFCPHLFLFFTYLESPSLSQSPQHLDFDKKSLTDKDLGIDDRELVAIKLNELFVIEYYSRKI
jgi:small subunit ribosomal protein S4